MCLHVTLGPKTGLTRSLRPTGHGIAQGYTKSPIQPRHLTGTHFIECVETKRPIAVVAQLKTRVLAARTLGLWTVISLKAWTFFLVFICCAIVYRCRPCVGQIFRPRSPTKCTNKVLISELELGMRPNP
jgi:hypothetical protein